MQSNQLLQQQRFSSCFPVSSESLYRHPTVNAAGPSKAAAPVAAPPKTELVLGRKWSVENHSNNRSLIIDQTDPKQSVYIFNCSNCTVQV